MKGIKLLNNESSLIIPGGHTIEIEDYYQVVDVITYLLSNNYQINYIVDSDYIGSGKARNGKEYSVMDIMQFYSIAKPRRNITVSINSNLNLSLYEILGRMNEKYSDNMKEAMTDYMVPVYYNTICYGQPMNILYLDDGIDDIIELWDSSPVIFKNKQIFLFTEEGVKSQKNIEYFIASALVEKIVKIDNINAIAILDKESDNEWIQYKSNDVGLNKYANFDFKNKSKENLFNTQKN